MKKTIILIIVLLFIVFAGFFYLGSLFTDKLIDEKISELKTGIISESDSSLKSLSGEPFALRRYLSSSIKKVSPEFPLVKITHSGQFKTRGDSDFLPYRSNTYYSTIAPGFMSDETIKTNAFTWIRALESLTDGKGNLLIKFLSSLTISDIQSDELDKTYLARYLFESVMFPFVLKPSDLLSWKKINNEIVMATLKYKNLSVTAKFHINRDNEVFKITTTDMYKTGDAGYIKTPSTILYSDYKWFGDYKIPTRLEVLWNLPDSSFTFKSLVVDNVEYINRQTE